MKQTTLALIMGLLAITSCNHKKHTEHEKVTYLVTSPVEKDITTKKKYVGQIRSIQHIELRALDEGYLQKIYVDEGQRVKEGKLLFKIMSIVYESEMKKAKAEANFAKIEYTNTKMLADSNIISQNQLALVKANYDKAKAELALTEAKLSFTEIRAPFDGIVGRFKDIRQGSLLEEGELLTTLSNNNKMWVYFNVPEAEYLDYTYNSSLSNLPKVSLQLANGQTFEKKGVIETIESDFNNETGNIAFRATFENSNGYLRHGQTGNIFLPKLLKNSLLIPQKTTFEVLSKKNVFVIDENGVVKSRHIEIDAEFPHLYAIKKGLKPKDQILLEGLRKVKDKDKIAFKIVPPDSVLSHLDLYAK